MIGFAFEEGEVLSWSVDAHHPWYDRMIEVWRKNRDAISGSEAIKKDNSREGLEEAQRYLPKLSGHSMDDYKDYKERAVWYGAAGRTLDAFVGMTLRKSPLFQYKRDGDEAIEDGEAKERIEDIIEKSTPDGRDGRDLITNVLAEVYQVNRVGLLEDFPSMMDGDGQIRQMTQLEFEQLGISSKTGIYKAESIINWHTTVVENQVVPTMFVLVEPEVAPKEEDPFTFEQSLKYRVLYLEYTDEGFVYRQALVRKQKKGNSRKEEFVVERVVTPLLDNEPMDRIPFWIITSEGVLYDTIKEPLLNDLVDVNIGHYRNSADYENELHKLAIKTAIFPGWDRDTQGDPELGGGIAAPPDQKPFYLEASSSSGIKEEMKAKEERMAALGAELLSGQGRYVASAETSRIRKTGETSVIQAVARCVERAISEVMTLKVRWSGLEVYVHIAMNDQAVPDEIDDSRIKQLVELFQSRLLSFETLFHNLQKAEIYPEGWTKDQELSQIEEDMEKLAPVDTGEMDEFASALEELRQRVSALEGGGGEAGEGEEE